MDQLNPLIFKVWPHPRTGREQAIKDQTKQTAQHHN